MPYLHSGFFDHKRHQHTDANLFPSILEVTLGDGVLLLISKVSGGPLPRFRKMPVLGNQQP